jgi:uncharacterized damage-inducible protein DinB
VIPITHRVGALGAMMDEFERAMRELNQLVGPLRQEAYLQVRDADSPDENSRTIQSVVKHVVQAGYAYIHYLRKALGIPFEKPDYQVETPLDAVRELENLASRTAETFEGKWLMSFEDMAALQFQVRWGPVYNLEQFLEHTIVHLLRHRRQVERFLTEARFQAPRREA